MKGNFVSKDDIQKARQADLAQYLISKGIPLIKVGRRYKSKEHDSLVFTANSYVWNSRGKEHGNSLDYVTRHMDIDFVTAVKELSQYTGASIPNAEKAFTINDIELNPNRERAIAYLNKTRGIDYRIIQDLINGKMLYQSKHESNIVFPIRDESGNIVGAELNGTLSNLRFKGIAENSLYGYGFSIRTCEIKDIRNYLFFESAIDLLSYINIELIRDNLASFSNCLFVSMGGLKENILSNALEAFKSDSEASIFLCVDNDSAGHEFCKLVSVKFEGLSITSAITSSYPKSINEYPVVPSSGKDWNELLIKSKKT